MNYKNSRDAAWQMLIKNRISSLPVSVHKLCKSEQVKLFTYEEGRALIQRLGLEEHTVENDAFSIGHRIFYDDTRPATRQRFSVAHELGHIVLHNPTEATVYNREISPSESPIEREANIFASRLLAPLCVLHFLNLNSAAEIAEVCSISMTAAEVRFARLCEVRERDRATRSQKGYGCFLLSPLERKAFENFKGFIAENRR